MSEQQPPAPHPDEPQRLPTPAGGDAGATSPSPAPAGEQAAVQGPPPAGGETGGTPPAANAGQPPRWQARLREPMRRVPPRWRIWLVALASVLILSLCVLLFERRSASAPQGPQQTAPGVWSFVVGSQPTLIFRHSIGNVHIVDGADGQVTITENRNGYTDAIQIHYVQQGDTITVTSDIESDLADGTWVDFEVHVPGQAGLNASLANGGTLEAEGLSGQIALSNTNGSIWATNLSGAIALTTQSGSINTNHVSGQLTLSTQNGTITTLNTTLSGHSRVQAETGTINFHGALDPSGSDEFLNSNGQVSLTLPQSSAFRLDARSAGGSINAGFPGISVRHTSSGNEARASVGHPPLAQLTIQTTTGPITLQPEL